MLLQRRGVRATHLCRLRHSLQVLPPNIRMNPGDDNAAFAILFGATKMPDDVGAEPHNAPAHPFYDSPVMGWNKSWIALRNTGSIQPKSVGSEFAEQKTDEWEKMVVVMESYAGDMKSLKASEPQKTLIVAELFKCMEKMSSYGFLHMDNKYLNMVQRTWRKDGQPVSSDKPWDQIEMKAIDFDPFFVKLCPWLPTDVLLLINVSCYLAFDRCYGGGIDLYRKALPRLKALHTGQRKVPGWRGRCVPGHLQEHGMVLPACVECLGTARIRARGTTRRSFRCSTMNGRLRAPSCITSTTISTRRGASQPLARCTARRTSILRRSLLP